VTGVDTTRKLHKWKSNPCREKTWRKIQPQGANCTARSQNCCRSNAGYKSMARFTEDLRTILRQFSHFRVTALQTLWNSLISLTMCGTHAHPLMITKDEITMYMCSYAICFTYWMLLNTHMNANIHLVMNSFGTLFHDKIFSLTIPWLLTASLTFPGHFQVFQTSGHPAS